jgi:hypothetical protein
MAFNLFEAPEYYQGLLGEEETKKLQGRAMTTGLVNAAIGYLAQPKTMGYGSALPYIGRALAGGLQSGQETIRSGLQDYETQQKLAEMKRKQGQQQELQTAISEITDPNERRLALLAPEEWVKSKVQKPQRKVEKVGRQLVDVTGDTPTVLFTGDAEDSEKIPVSAQEFERAQKDPAFKKFLQEKWTAQAQFNAPYKSAEQERQDIETAYKYGVPPSAVPAPKSATMQDVADTAKATGKTTNQVIQDLKSRGIRVQGAK